MDPAGQAVEVVTVPTRTLGQEIVAAAVQIDERQPFAQPRRDRLVPRGRGLSAVSRVGPERVREFDLVAFGREGLGLDPEADIFHQIDLERPAWQAIEDEHPIAVGGRGVESFERLTRLRPRIDIDTDPHQGTALRIADMACDGADLRWGLCRLLGDFPLGRISDRELPLRCLRRDFHHVLELGPGRWQRGACGLLYISPPGPWFSGAVRSSRKDSISPCSGTNSSRRLRRLDEMPSMR